MKLGPRGRAKPDQLLDALTTAVISLDSDLRVNALNPATETLFGVSQRHALGQPFPVAIPHFLPHAPRLRQALDAGSGFIEREMKLQKNGDATITADCTVTPVATGRGGGLLLELAALDRHLRISRDEQMSAQFDASRELIRGLAHEIKNPLGGIRGAAQLMEQDFPDSEHREYTGVIIRETDRLQALVDRLLGPSKPATRKPLNLHEIVEHVRQLVRAEAPEGIAFERDYDPSIPDTVADREQLVQALLNIARNALQSIGGEGLLTFRTRTRRQVAIGGAVHRLCAVLEVEDDGPGIEAAVLDKVFYPMFTTRAEGTGLGLPIAQYLVHAHGGMLEAASRPGCTVFAITLPLEAA